MTRPFKIPPAKRRELIDRYVNEGHDAVAAELSRYNVGPGYIRFAALAEGKRRRPLASSKSINTDGDPRWAWAKARGTINV